MICKVKADFTMSRKKSEIVSCIQDIVKNINVGVREERRTRGVGGGGSRGGLSLP